MSDHTIKTSIIAAMGRNREIGRDNTLMWDIPQDMAWFRDNTRGKPIIMGRKTYESIGRLLPKRLNIIITRQESYSVDGAIVTNSLENALDIGIKKAQENNLKEVFIIGGQQIYELGLPLADRLYLTHIEKSYDGADTFFPELNTSNWDIVSCETFQKTDKTPAFSFKKYDRQ